MAILCHKCWSELKATITICPSCGALVDLYSRDYERCLCAALGRSDVQRRIHICSILGCRGKRSATPVLVGLLHDPDTSVREAAIRAIGEIGDRSAATAVEKLTNSQNDGVRTAAKYVLKILIGSGGAEPSHR
jgi:HEAT repeat protein